MLPEPFLRAAARWVDLLERLGTSEAQAIIRSSHEYADLSLTLYASALDWLTELAVVEPSPDGPRLADAVADLPPQTRRQLVFEAALAHEAPAWLENGDVTAASADDLPADALSLAAGLGIGEETAALGVLKVYGHIDLQRRAEVGGAGETALATALREIWPSAVDHIALRHDGFGYDLALAQAETEWHLEVKSTSRRGRLVVHISRHEYEVASRDPYWRLVVVGLAQHDLRLLAVATVDHRQLLDRVPTDRVAGGRWTAARFEVAQSELSRGLSFVSIPSAHGAERNALAYGEVGQPHFGWMPLARPSTSRSRS